MKLPNVDKNVLDQSPQAVPAVEQATGPIPELGTLSAIVKTLRVHQWVKNLLLFVPAAMAHQLHHFDTLASVLLAALAFCFTSSFVYICNDLVDRESDRQHRTKRFRPIASGALGMSSAILVAGLLLSAASAIALTLPANFGLLLALYVLVCSAYSLVIKRIIAADIVVLSSLYTLRVLAGAYAVPVEVSQWLLLFSMFFFLSLAGMKRFSELRVLRLNNGQNASGRGYRAEDLELVSQSGCASGYISVLVLALYVSSREVSVLYQAPQLIYLICPLVLFWVTRVWLLAHRGEMHDDPIVFALRDPVSYVVAVLGAGVLWLAI